MFFLFFLFPEHRKLSLCQPCGMVTMQGPQTRETCSLGELDYQARCQRVLPCLEEKGELGSPAPPARQTPEHFSAFQVNLEDVNLYQQRKGREI